MNTKSKIVIIGPGNNVHIQRWLIALRERDLNVSLIATTPVSPLLSWFPHYAIPTATAGMTPMQRIVTLLHGWARVPALARSLKPDLAHLHSLPTPAAVPFARRVGPLVASPWGSDVVQRDRRKARLYPALLRHAAQITATSRYLADVTARYFDRSCSIAIVPFGVDPDRFRPATASPSRLRVGTLRHLERNYGLDVLLDAWPIVLRAQPHVELVIGGGGSLERELRAQAAQLGIERHVRWLGRLDHDAVPRFLQSLTVFAMPSRAESFGVAALEAQACGLPVIASDVGGLPDVVRDGITGALVPPEDPSALARALIDLLAEPQRQRAWGAAGRTWVIERYTWDDSVDRMMAVYRNVIGYSGAGGI